MRNLLATTSVAKAHLQFQRYHATESKHLKCKHPFGLPFIPVERYPESMLIKTLINKLFSLFFILLAIVIVGQAHERPKVSSAGTSRKIIHGHVIDTNGQVVNVKAYGAKGDGISDDTPAFNAALRAAQVHGGKIYFPPGTFVLNNPDAITFQKSSNSISIECAGPTATTLLLKGNGFALKYNWASPYFYGSIRDCKFDLSQAPAGSVAIHLVDSDGWSIEDDSFTSFSPKKRIGIELENQGGWCERNYLVHNSFNGLNPAILFQQDPGDKYNSFAYNILAFDEFLVPKGGDGIQVNGPSVVYSNFWVLRVNMEGSGNLVNAIHGAHLRYNFYDIRGEGGGAGAYMLCGDSTSGISGNGTVYSFGAGNDQGSTCPGKGNITIYTQVAGASNLHLSNWIGTGKAVNVYGGSISIDGGAGSGNVIGSNISSPFVWMYRQPGNAFVIGDVPYPPSLSKFAPVSWFDDSGNGIFTGHLQIGGSRGATWSSGSKPPTGSCSNGSLYSNTSGSAGSTLYVCVSGYWADIK